MDRYSIDLNLTLQFISFIKPSNLEQSYQGSVQVLFYFQSMLLTEEPFEGFSLTGAEWSSGYIFLADNNKDIYFQAGDARVDANGSVSNNDTNSLCSQSVSTLKENGKSGCGLRASLTSGAIKTFFPPPSDAADDYGSYANAYNVRPIAEQTDFQVIYYNLSDASLGGCFTSLKLFNSNQPLPFYRESVVCSSIIPIYIKSTFTISTLESFKARHFMKNDLNKKGQQIKFHQPLINPFISKHLTSPDRTSRKQGD